MRTLIVYASKHGCTEKAATMLAARLTGEISLVNIAKQAIPSLDTFDTVVIGGSIYVGKIQAPIREFCDKNLSVLREKRVGLFTCAANKAQVGEQLKQNFPADLLEVAQATGHFGYAISMEKMNFLERTAVKVIMKATTSCEHILEENISIFADRLDSGQ